MDVTKIFYVVGSLALVALFVLNRLIARTVLPLRLLRGVQGRSWTARELAILVAPGIMVTILGLLFLQGAFWDLLSALSLAMLVSALALWALARRWPHLSLFRKTVSVFALYLLVALASVAPVAMTSNIRWTHSRGILALVVGLLALVFACAALLLVVGCVTLYFAMAGEIARAVFLGTPAVPVEQGPAETLDGTEPLPPQPEYIDDAEARGRLAQ